MMEIERRFLCRIDDPTLLARADSRALLRQGYLTAGEPAVRVRQRGDAYILTVKAGRGLVRREVEVDVPADRGEALLEMAGDFRVDKVRHALGRWEIDVFQGRLRGLVLAEVELEREDEPLPPPPHGLTLLREVTDDGRFTNQRLAALDAAGAECLLAEVEAAARAG